MQAFLANIQVSSEAIRVPPSNKCKMQLPMNIPYQV